MSGATLLSMALFALALSITPGPVNVLSLGSGLRHGAWATLPHVAGATVGFVILLSLSGLGLVELMNGWPLGRICLPWLGAAFILWQAWKLWRDAGSVETGGGERPPRAIDGLLLQWLNPKAWMACLAGIGLFGGTGWRQMAVFVALYFVICFASLTAWAVAGSWLRTRKQLQVGRFNRVMALLLAGSALSILPW